MKLPNTEAGSAGPGCYRSGVSEDADVHSAALNFGRWKQRYDQLSSGRFEGGLEELELPPFTVLKESSNRIVHQAGSGPSGVFAIGAVTWLNGGACFQGDILRRGCLVVVDPLREFELRTSENFEILGAVFNPETLCSYVNDPAIDFRELERDLYRVGRTVDNPQTEPLQSFLRRLLEVARENSEGVRDFV